MERTTNLSLPYIMPSQAQKHVTHNEALRALDALVQIGVVARDRSEPPASPAEGARYIVPDDASGVFAGRQDQVAAFQDGAWMFYPPAPGWLAWVDSEKLLVAFDGTQWTGSVETLPRLGIAATADAGNPLTVKGPGSLFDNTGADHRITVNKSGAADTASVVFQTSYSGRAEFGLTGDDAFHLKTSIDGTAWSEALTISNGGRDVALPDGRLGIGTSQPAERLEIVDERPSFKVTGTQYGTDITFSASDQGSLFFKKAAGSASWNFRINPLDGTSPAQFLFGQSTGSTGPTVMDLFNPDNTLQTRIGSAAVNSYVCVQGGRFGVGTSSPGEKLHVVGRIKGETLLPATDNAFDLGSASLRYATIYAGSDVISTSDAALKHDVRSIPDAILEALRPLSAKLYQYSDAVAAKGEQGARWHYGFVAQEVENALSRLDVEGRTIDSFRHALLCRDEIVEDVVVGEGEMGDAIVEQRPTGRYRYALRYSEFFALRDEMHRRDLQALEGRIFKLEAG